MTTSDSTSTRNPRPCHLYIMQSADAVKIGISYEPKKRRRELVGSSATPVTLLRSYECPSVDHARQLEYALHVHFAAYNRHGEWFNLTPEDVYGVMDWIIENGRLPAVAKPNNQNPTEYTDTFSMAADWNPTLTGSSLAWATWVVTRTLPKKFVPKVNAWPDENALLIAARDLRDRIGRISISMLQRRLKIGYERAKRVYGQISTDVDE